MQKINNLFLRIRTNKINQHKCFGKDIKFIPVEILYCKNIKRFKKRIDKAKKLLSKYNVTKVILTDEIREILNEKRFYGIPNGSLITAFKLLYNKLSVNKCKSISIYDKDLSFFSYINAKQIIFMANRIILYTNNICSANNIADKLFYEYGVLIDVKNYLLICDNNKFIVDADNGIVRVGDIYADNVDYDINCEKYNVDLRYLIDNTDVSGNIKIKNLISGKNLIKLVDN